MKGGIIIGCDHCGRFLGLDGETHSETSPVVEHFKSYPQADAAAIKAGWELMIDANEKSTAMCSGCQTVRPRKVLQ